MGNRLFFVSSLSMSLLRWKIMGILEKELKIVAAYVEGGKFEKIILLTYDRDEKEAIRLLGDLDRSIQLVCMPSWWPKGKIGDFIFSFMCPLFLVRYKGRRNFIFNNQTSGAWAALISKVLMRGRFVYRCGHSLWKRHLDRKQYLRLFVSYPLDLLLSIFSDRILVPTSRDFATCAFKYKATVCPNFIDMKDFPKLNPPMSERPEKGFFVGRFMYFKNLENLCVAAIEKDTSVDFYGSGPDEVMLKERYGDNPLLHFKGKVDNSVLISSVMPKYRVFFLVSTYEGMPKALLEAMASGCVCIVSPHPGCTEVIQDGLDGVVCDGYSSSSISRAISRLEGLDLDSISQNARASVMNKYSLESVLAIHYKAYGLIDD